MRLVRFALPLGTILLASMGCSEPEAISADTSESDLTGRVSGATISSPNANAAATYLSARRIDTLQSVGALRGVLENLALRVDGIIANQPADGRISIKEILQIEKPGFIGTLFPDEKAALSDLWKLLETTNASPGAMTLPPLVSLSAVDISTPAGAPIVPTKLDIASLPLDLQLSAKRLELTQDSDGDPTTVTQADLAAAIATPGPYTTAEISDFKTIELLFLERAVTSLSARVQVTAPGSTTTPLTTWGTASLDLFQSVEYSESRGRPYSNGSLGVTIQGHLVQKAVVTLAGSQKLVLLDETTEDEVVLGSGFLESKGGPTTI
jgi:hypothetical protein